MIFEIFQISTSSRLLVRSRKLSHIYTFIIFLYFSSVYSLLYFSSIYSLLYLSLFVSVIFALELAIF